MPIAMRFQHLAKVPRDRGQRPPNVGMMRGLDVIDQSVERPAAHVVSLAVRSPDRIQRLQDDSGIGGGAPAGVVEGSAAAAAKIDAEPFEDFGGAEVGGDDVADRRAVESVAPLMVLLVNGVCRPLGIV